MSMNRLYQRKCSFLYRRKNTGASPSRHFVKITVITPFPPSHVAGIIAGDGTLSGGHIQGIAPQVFLMLTEKEGCLLCWKAFAGLKKMGNALVYKL